MVVSRAGVARGITGWDDAEDAPHGFGSQGYGRGPLTEKRNRVQANVDVLNELFGNANRARAGDASSSPAGSKSRSTSAARPGGHHGGGVIVASYSGGKKAQGAQRTPSGYAGGSKRPHSGKASPHRTKGAARKVSPRSARRSPAEAALGRYGSPPVAKAAPKAAASSRTSSKSPHLRARAASSSPRATNQVPATHDAAEGTREVVRLLQRAVLRAWLRIAAAPIPAPHGYVADQEAVSTSLLSPPEPANVDAFEPAPEAAVVAVAFAAWRDLVRRRRRHARLTARLQRQSAMAAVRSAMAQWKSVLSRKHAVGFYFLASQERKYALYRRFRQWKSATLLALDFSKEFSREQYLRRAHAHVKHRRRERTLGGAWHAWRAAIGQSAAADASEPNAQAGLAHPHAEADALARQRHLGEVFALWCLRTRLLRVEAALAKHRGTGEREGEGRGAGDAMASVRAKHRLLAAQFQHARSHTMDQLFLMKGMLTAMARVVEKRSGGRRKGDEKRGALAPPHDSTMPAEEGQGDEREAGERGEGGEGGEEAASSMEAVMAGAMREFFASARAGRWHDQMMRLAGRTADASRRVAAFAAWRRALERAREAERDVQDAVTRALSSPSSSSSSSSSSHPQGKGGGAGVHGGSDLKLARVVRVLLSRRCARQTQRMATTASVRRMRVRALLRLWRAAALEAREELQRWEVARRRMSRLTLRQAYRAWHSGTERMGKAQRRMGDVLRRTLAPWLDRRTLLRGWCEAARAGLLRAHRRHAALRKAHRGKMRRLAMAWRDACEAVRSERRVVARMNERLQRQRHGRAFLAWSGMARRTVRTRTVGRFAAHRARNAALLRHFMLWRKGVDGAKHTRGKQKLRAAMKDMQRELRRHKDVIAMVEKERKDASKKVGDLISAVTNLNWKMGQAGGSAHHHHAHVIDSRDVVTM